MIQILCSLLFLSMKSTLHFYLIILMVSLSYTCLGQASKTGNQQISKEVTPYFVAIGFESRTMQGDTLILRGVDRVVGKAPYCDGFESNDFSTIKFRESSGQIWFMTSSLEFTAGCSSSILPVDTALAYQIYYVKIGDERSYLFNNYSGKPTAVTSKKNGK